MGLLSSSRSESNVNYTTNSVTTNEDSRMAAGDNSLVVRLDGDGAQFSTSNVTTNTTNNYSADDRIIGASAAAISDAGRTVSGVLPFLKSATDRAYDDLSEARSSLQSTYAKFSSDTAAIYNAGNARATAAEQAAYAFSRSTLDNTLNFGRDTLQASQDQSSTALAAIRQTSETLLNFITQREKDPNERAFSQVVPWLVGGAVIIGIFAFGSKSK